MDEIVAVKRCNLHFLDEAELEGLMEEAKIMSKYRCSLRHAMTCISYHDSSLEVGPSYHDGIIMDVVMTRV